MVRLDQLPLLHAGIRPALLNREIRYEEPQKSDRLDGGLG